MSNPTIPTAKLLQMVEQIFLSCGLAAPQALSMAGVLVSAERDACKSHGVFRIAAILRTIKAGKVCANALPTVASADGTAIVRANAHGGFAIGAFDAALPHLVERARNFGLAALALNEGSHISALWYEVEALTREGLAALVMCPNYATVAPTGGFTPLLGTNPIAFGWPRRGTEPYVFDFATSVAARGEIELYRRAGNPLPDGWALDAEGQPTNDATAALEGAMLPFGGHKGSALSTMVELLSGSLIGDKTSPEVSALMRSTVFAPNHGELVIALSPELFARGRVSDPFASAEALLAAIVSQGARLPSQRRFAARKQSDAAGISLTETEFAELERFLLRGLDAI